MSIGYELNVTALQSAMAYATIANDGVQIKPHIIKEIRTADGKILPAPEAERKQIVKPEVARELRKMLRQVVLKGTAKRAQLNGYTSAGKTGTAWKYDARIKGYNRAKYISSFVGFAPADNPSVVIAVVMDEPQGGARDGGQVSAPIFRQIAEQILPELNVPPDGSIMQETLTAQNDIPAEAEITPDLPHHEEPENVPAKSLEKASKSEKVKEVKKESKPAGEEKNPLKQKTAAVVNMGKSKGDTKNKAASERTRQKT